MSNINNNNPPEIITRFARQLSHIVADYLSNPDLYKQRHPPKDRFAIKLMLTLSQAEIYRQELLYRDYSLAPDEICEDYSELNGEISKRHTESIFYVQAVLGKRLQPVAKRKSQPTNLHFLFLMLCRYSQDTQWMRTWIKRKREPTNDIHDAFFKPVAEKLKKKCMAIKNLSTLAKNNRERYGALNLMAGFNRAEMPEEISLFDVIEIVPGPLSGAIKKLPVWYPSLTHLRDLYRQCSIFSIS